MLAVLVAKCDVIALELPTDHRSVGCNLGAQVIGRSRGRKIHNFVDGRGQQAADTWRE